MDYLHDIDILQVLKSCLVQDFIRVPLCIDLRRRLWDQALRFTTLGDSNRWRGSNKYSDLLTRSIYSTLSNFQFWCILVNMSKLLKKSLFRKMLSQSNFQTSANYFICGLIYKGLTSWHNIIGFFFISHGKMLTCLKQLTS